MRSPLTWIVPCIALVTSSSAGTPADAIRGLLPPPVEDTDFHDDGRPAEEKVELGRMLFFDRDRVRNVTAEQAQAA